MEEKKIIDMLTEDSVSIMTKRYVTVGNQSYEAGMPHRVAYVNSRQGRDDLQREQMENIVNSVFAMWGDSPTVQEGSEGQA